MNWRGPQYRSHRTIPRLGLRLLVHYPISDDGNRSYACDKTSKAASCGCLQHMVSICPNFGDSPIEKPSELHEKAQNSAYCEQVPPVRLEIRKRGRKPVKLEKVKQEMRRDIQEDRETMASLGAMPEKELQDYGGGVSRDTGRKARNAILSEITKEVMRRDIREGGLTAAGLREMLENKLEERYGVFRAIAGEARDEVLSEFVEELNPDK